jgi:hypothetical protein
MPEYVDLSGIPWQLLAGFGCNLLAFLFLFVWPKAKAKPYEKRISWPGYILHYFHPLAWELLGIAAFLQVVQPVTAIVLAVLGVAAFVVFIVMLVKA